MKYNPDKHHRQSIRLKRYDYTSSGAYFITICAYQRECLFGDIVDGVVNLNQIGLGIQNHWQDLPNRFPYMDLDAFVVMPNHLHGIIWLCDDTARRDKAFVSACRMGVQGLGTNASSLQPHGTQPKSIGAIIQNFKSISTRKINRMTSNVGRTIWQLNYYEHIIRNAESLQRIRQYIHQNPLSWQQDQLHLDQPPQP
jgi:putative transposase